MIFLVFDFVILGSRKYRIKANNIGNQIAKKGFNVKLINKSAPRIEKEGIDVLRRLKTKYQREHFEAIRWCKKGVILCNFEGYIGLNTKAELIFANAYDVPIFSVEPVKSDKEEIIILNIQKLNLLDM